MIKYTPKQLAAELNIENKQEMRNMLRDYKEVLNPEPSNTSISYYRRAKDDRDISCGPYMTYGENDLLKLRQIQIFKQLGVKKSKIVSLMNSKDNNSVIDELIEMLEKRQKEIKEQLIMAKHLKALGGMKSYMSEVFLLGKTPHQYAEGLKEEMKSEYTMKVALYYLGRMLNQDEILKYLSDIDCMEIQRVKEFVDGSEFREKVMKQTKFDADFGKKLNKLLGVLLQYKPNDVAVSKRIHTKIKEFIRYMEERYDFSGLVEFGLLWLTREGVLTNAGYGKKDQEKIDYAIILCLNSDAMSKQEQISARIMFELVDWTNEWIECMEDVFGYIDDNDLKRAHDMVQAFIDEKTAIKNQDDLIFFEYFIRKTWSNMEPEIRSSIEEGESYEAVEEILAKFYKILQEGLDAKLGDVNE